MFVSKVHKILFSKFGKWQRGWIETGIDRLLLVSKVKKKFNFSKIYWKSYFHRQNHKYLRPFLSSLKFPKF